AATRVHSRYYRTVADRPWNMVQVRLRICSRKFLCDPPTCARAIFTERLPGLVERSGRRTCRLMELLQLIGAALGGEAGARLGAGGQPRPVAAATAAGSDTSTEHAAGTGGGRFRLSSGAALRHAPRGPGAPLPRRPACRPRGSHPGALAEGAPRGGDCDARSL